jgi:hypothetical protein
VADMDDKVDQILSQMSKGSKADTVSASKH